MYRHSSVRNSNSQIAVLGKHRDVDGRLGPSCALCMWVVQRNVCPFCVWFIQQGASTQHFLRGGSVSHFLGVTGVQGHHGDWVELGGMCRA